MLILLFHIFFPLFAFPILVLVYHFHHLVSYRIFLTEWFKLLFISYYSTESETGCLRSLVSRDKISSQCSSTILSFNFKFFVSLITNFLSIFSSIFYILLSYVLDWFVLIRYLYLHKCMYFHFYFYFQFHHLFIY